MKMKRSLYWFYSNFYLNARIWVLPVLIFVQQKAYSYESIKDFRKGLWETSIGSSFFLTNNNYNSDGATSSLNSGNKYQIFEFDFNSRYVFSPNWAVSGQLDSAMGESTATDATRRNTNLSSAKLAGELSFDIGQMVLIPQVSLLMPFEKTSNTQDSVMIGEGVMETHMRLYFQSYFGSFVGFGYMGYDVRSNGRSHQFPYSVGAMYRTSNISFGGRLFGFQKASDDQDAGTNASNERIATSQRVNGGSLLFYSINPSVMKAEVIGMYNINRRWSFGISAGMTLSGTNYAQGFFGEGVFIFRPSLGESVRTRSYRDLPRDRKELEQKDFNEDVNDGVDQKLFDQPKKNKPKDPINDPVVVDDVPDVKPEAPRRRAIIKNDQEIKKKLNDAEMTIELRHNKTRARKRK